MPSQISLPFLNSYTRSTRLISNIITRIMSLSLLTKLLLVSSEFLAMDQELAENMNRVNLGESESESPSGTPWSFYQSSTEMAQLMRHMRSWTLEVEKDEETGQTLDFLRYKGKMGGSDQPIQQSHKSDQLGLTTEPKKIFIMFGLHARELISSEVGISLMQDIENNNGLKELEDSNLFDVTVSPGDANRQPPLSGNYEILLLPNANPKGRDAVLAAVRRPHAPGPGPGSGAHLCDRGNGHGIDLNRNFGGLDREGRPNWKSPEDLLASGETQSNRIEKSGALPFSEPESRLIKKKIEAFVPDIFIDTHTGEFSILFPYAHDPDLLDQKFYQEKLLKLGANLNKQFPDLKLPYAAFPYFAKDKIYGSILDYVSGVQERNGKKPWGVCFEMYGRSAFNTDSFYFNTFFDQKHRDKYSNELVFPDTIPTEVSSGEVTREYAAGYDNDNPTGKLNRSYYNTRTKEEWSGVAGELEYTSCFSNMFTPQKEENLRRGVELWVPIIKRTVIEVALMDGWGIQPKEGERLMPASETGLPKPYKSKESSSTVPQSSQSQTSSSSESGNSKREIKAKTVEGLSEVGSSAGATQHPQPTAPTGLLSTISNYFFGPGTQTPPANMAPPSLWKWQLQCSCFILLILAIVIRLYYYLFGITSVTGPGQGSMTSPYDSTDPYKLGHYNVRNDRGGSEPTSPIDYMRNVISNATNASGNNISNRDNSNQNLDYDYSRRGVSMHNFGSTLNDPFDDRNIINHQGIQGLANDPNETGGLSGNEDEQQVRGLLQEISPNSKIPGGKYGSSQSSTMGSNHGPTIVHSPPKVHSSHTNGGENHMMQNPYSVNMNSNINDINTNRLRGDHVNHNLNGPGPGPGPNNYQQPLNSFAGNNNVSNGRSGGPFQYYNDSSRSNHGQVDEHDYESDNIMNSNHHTNSNRHLNMNNHYCEGGHQHTAPSSNASESRSSNYGSERSTTYNAYPGFHIHQNTHSSSSTVGPGPGPGAGPSMSSSRSDMKTNRHNMVTNGNQHQHQHCQDTNMSNMDSHIRSNSKSSQRSDARRQRSRDSQGYYGGPGSNNNCGNTGAGNYRDSDQYPQAHHGTNYYGSNHGHWRNSGTAAAANNNMNVNSNSDYNNSPQWSTPINNSHHHRRTERGHRHIGDGSMSGSSRRSRGHCQNSGTPMEHFA